MTDKERIAELEAELELIKSNPFYEMYDAITYQLRSMAKQIKQGEIKLDDKDDKSFERIIKAMQESKGIAENAEWLKLKLGITDKKESETVIKNPIERRAAEKKKA